MNRLLGRKWFKIPVHVLCLVPAVLLAWRVYANHAGPNPVEFVTHQTGDWTIWFLLITLTITPLRKLTNLTNLIRFRRLLGLWAFAFGTAHLITYVWLDKFFDFRDIWNDIFKRPFITVGFIGFLLMLPLAITSTAGWIRRLGGKNWQRMHRAIYFSALAGVIHYLWLVKSDRRLPLLDGAILGVLMLCRLGIWFMKSPPRPVASVPVRAG